jgi:hypothetical protein
MIKKLEETTFAASLDKFASGLVSYFDDGRVLALSLVHQLRLAAKNAETLAEDQSPWLK